MSRPGSRYPTELELLILKVLWQSSPLRARDIQLALAKGNRELAKTSVITTLNTMVEKKYLSRKQDGNAYLFSPRISDSEVSEKVLGDVVDRVFDGSPAAVLLKLFDVKDLDPDELKEMRRMINRELKKDQ